ncbi:putative toxin-antitoxin system antitoxin component, TIGR02293 family [Lysobacter sp. yr284]|uniref:antitoxin Xre/MbcA/ParS toxin-binding domain-containing protein n=1 Tax=Lysobacter sp. yr284 TaxID=1761791 RepID=UPI00089CEF9A|nr:antitoxin Xre/MbcA/ParS toxin-binding domain-containing protein [Lysobacter sp. yr284]SDY93761.1 putative toxin-antitoxin system antitoxin component, TIGR02293 family [Lysobacter sp. yr284]
MSTPAKPPAPAKGAANASAKPAKTAAPRGRREAAHGVRDAAAYPRPASKRSLSVKEPLAAEAYGAPATLNGYVAYLRTATPLQRVEAEREGVPARMVKHMASDMDLPAVRMFDILGIAKATAEAKAAQQAHITGASGQAALGLIHLLGIARDIVDDSTDPAAPGFDAARWLGHWIEQPQAALGGQRPADLLDTPTGLSVVARLLGSLASGAYQ